MVAHSSTLELESELQADVDVVDEIRLRIWAIQNYVPEDQRDGGWHPIILEEMRSKDREDEC